MFQLHEFGNIRFLTKFKGWSREKVEKGAGGKKTLMEGIQGPTQIWKIELEDIWKQAPLFIRSLVFQIHFQIQ